jgi:hypothetical protein
VMTSLEGSTLRSLEESMAVSFIRGLLFRLPRPKQVDKYYAQLLNYSTLFTM